MCNHVTTNKCHVIVYMHVYIMSPLVVLGKAVRYDITQSTDSCSYRVQLFIACMCACDDER